MPPIPALCCAACCAVCNSALRSPPDPAITVVQATFCPFQFDVSVVRARGTRRRAVLRCSVVATNPRSTTRPRYCHGTVATGGSAVRASERTFDIASAPVPTLIKGDGDQFRVRRVSFLSVFLPLLHNQPILMQGNVRSRISVARSWRRLPFVPEQAPWKDRQIASLCIRRTCLWWM